MKKYIILFMACCTLVCFSTGCADVLESSLDFEIGEEEKTNFKIQKAETLLYTEEGYYVAEGSLCELGKSDFCLKMNDEQRLCFKLSPETIIYAGENKEISEGQAVKVVFDGELNGENMEKVSVIAIATLEDEY